MVSSTTDSYAGVAPAGVAVPFGGLEAEALPDRAPIDDFRRLVNLVRDNERLLAELDATRAKIRRAWAYLSDPGGNAALALAHLERLRLRRSALLAHLRANRVEARALLGREVPGGEHFDLN